MSTVRFALLLAVCFIHHVELRNIYDDPPPQGEKAKMARYVVHNADWTSIGTISTQKGIKGFPFVGLKSVADGPRGDGRGVPYMLMTDMDVSMKDLLVDNRCTLFFSLAEGDYCHSKNYDPQDPRCARIMLTGSVQKVNSGDEDYQFAKESLLSRHPAMSGWPIDHGFYIAKLKIMQVAVLDYFGGMGYVSPKDYMNANLNHPVIFSYDDNNGIDIQVRLIK